MTCKKKLIVFALPLEAVSVAFCTSTKTTTRSGAFCAINPGPSK